MSDDRYDFKYDTDYVKCSTCGHWHSQHHECRGDLGDHDLRITGLEDRLSQVEGCLGESPEDIITRITLERNQARAKVEELFEVCNELLARVRRIPELKIKRVGKHEMPIPTYAYPGDSGLDLRASSAYMEEGNINHALPIDDERDSPRHSDNQPKHYLIWPGRLMRIPCGFAFEIPRGYEATVRPRSSLTSQSIIAHLGTIDNLYRGEVGVILENRSGEAFRVSVGDRIAQLVIGPVAHCEVKLVDNLSESERGERGWGSTGVR